MQSNVTGASNCFHGSGILTSSVGLFAIEQICRYASQLKLPVICFVENSLFKIQIQAAWLLTQHRVCSEAAQDPLPEQCV